MLNVGQTISYIPDINIGKSRSHKRVSGVITYINHAHNYFLVEHQCGNGVIRECHKFYDGFRRDCDKDQSETPMQFRHYQNVAIF